MKKTIGWIAATALVLLSCVTLAQQVTSLRGPDALDATKPAEMLKKTHEDTQPLQRNYVQQPPLIPHEIRGYDVNLNNNKCLNCHSWKNYQKFNATKISQTHFKDRDGNELSDVAERRYFCLQCHVPQADAQPLIDNTFQPVDALDSSNH